MFEEKIKFDQYKWCMEA